MSRKFNVTPFEQPIGTLYLSKLEATTLIEMCEVNQREYIGEYPNQGEQRDLSIKRAKEIASYAKNPDATFPTPIILAVKYKNYDLNIDSNSLIIHDNTKVRVLDGQHRVRGLELAGENVYKNFELPIVFVLDPTQEESAYIFSIINSTQTRVSPSLIYDLFEVSRFRSPQKTCHEIARSLNNDNASPFYKKLKMLGKGGGPYATISQASFIKFLLENITKKPSNHLNAMKQGKKIEAEDLPFNQYYLEEKDALILKILVNIFSAVRNVFPEEWDSPDKYILSKAIGYGGILKALPIMMKYGKSRSALDYTLFNECMQLFQKTLHEKKIQLTSENFSSSEQDRKKFANLIKEALYGN